MTDLLQGQLRERALLAETINRDPMLRDMLDRAADALEESRRLKVELAAAREINTNLLVVGAPHRRSNRKWDALERDLAAAEETLAAIRDIVDPAWTRGRVLPQYLGAENAARIHAITAVLNDDEAEDA